MNQKGDIFFLLLRHSLLCFVLLSIVFFSSSVYALEKNALLISSYHPGFPTFLQQIAGVESVFSTKGIHLDVEFMDSKRFYSDEDVELFHAMLKHKLSMLHPYDIILTADDNALRYVLHHRQELFPQTPIVFCGVNNKELAQEAYNAGNITGVIEDTSMKETINTILAMRPQSDTIYAIVDSTPSGQADLTTYKQLRHQYPNTKLEVISLETLTWEDFASRLKSLKQSDTLLLLSAYRDVKNTSKTFQESLEFILKNTQVPTFHLWEHGLGQGLVGGKVISQFEQGRRAALLALELLQGKSASQLPLIDGNIANKYIFDYAVLNTFSIDPSLAPQSSIFLNKPSSLWEKYKRAIITGLSVTFLLLIFSAFLFIYALRLRTVRQMLRKANSRLNEAQRVGGIGNWEWNLEKDTMIWSDNLYSMLGVSSEMPSPSYQDQLALFSTQDSRQLDEVIANAINNAEPYELELSRVRPDGNMLYFLVRGAPETNESGRVIRLYGTMLDITGRKDFEKKLKASEERYRKVVSSIQETLSVISHDGTIRFANARAATNLCGYPDPECVIGKNIREFIPKDQSEEIISRITTVIQNQVPLIEEIMVTLSSKDTWMRNSVTPIAYGDQNESCVLSLSLDITEQIHARQELEISQVHLKRVLNATTDAIWELDITSMNMSFSAKYSSILGYEEKELPTTFENWSMLLHPDDRPDTLNQFYAYIEGRTATYRSEFRLLHKSGDYIWLESNGKIVEHAPDGTLTLMIGNHADVTQRKRTEQLLAEAHKRLSFHINNSPLAIVEWKDGTHIAAWSKQAEHIFGWKEDEVLGKSWADFDFVYPEDKQLVQKQSDQLFSGQLPFNTIINRNYRKDKTVVHCHWYNSPLRDAQGKIISILSQVADISELKHFEETLIAAKEQAETANRVKSEFLANMSHEIRTPLNGVLGILQLLNTSDINATQKEYIELAIQSSKRLNHLLSDILDISRIEANRVMIHNSPFNLPQAVQQSCALFEVSSSQTGVNLICEIDPKTPQTVIGDVMRLTQILNNLLGNAFKFTQKGFVHLKVYPLKSAFPDKVNIHISIQDTGMGIEDEQIGKLFKPFSQISEGFQRHFQGAGLGLALCKQFTALMGGTLAIESEVNVGTTFHISIPMQPIATDIDGPSQSPAPSRADSGGCGVLVRPEQVTILLAEDDEINQIVLKQILESCGYHVVTAHDGEEALSILKSRAHDIKLILMDIQMPIMNGIEVTQAIRQGKAGEDNVDIPIIALTACVMKGNKESFLDSGMNAYIAKPVGLDLLQTTIERVLRSEPIF